MNKIYIVKAPQGEYDGYSEPIVKIFLDEKKAKKYVEEENAKLPLEQAKKCEECHHKWKMSFETNQPIPDCLLKDKYDTCENYFKYHDIQALFMEEHEVEE